MSIYENINRLTSYALLNSLITKEDVIYTKNRLLELFQLDGFENDEQAASLPEVKTEELEEILKELLDWAGENKIFDDQGIVSRDLFDTKIMGQLVPPPSDVIDIFHTIYDEANHPGVRLMDYRTTPTIKKYRLIFNAAPKIGIWQLNYTASLEYNDEDLEPLGITHNFKGLCTEFNLDNTFTLPKAWLLNIQGYIEPYYRSGFHIFKTSGSLNLRLSRQFLKDKSLSVALLARDILRTDYVKGTEYNGIGYRVDVETYRDRRRIGIDLSWKFNATRSRYKGSHAGQSERNRL